METITTPSTETTPPASTTTTPNSERPAWLPEKFKSPEEMAASYKELETKLGGTSTTTPTTTPTTPKVNFSDPVETAKVLAAQGLDFDALNQEYLRDGKLSDASMQAITAKGFTKEQVSGYIDGQKAISERNSKEIFDSVGGEDKFNKVIEYGKTVMTAQEIAAYNKAVNSGDYATLKMITAGLNAKFEAKMGKEPNLATGAVNQEGPGGYPGVEDWQLDLMNPLYDTSPSFRNLVVEKLKRSAWAPKG